MSGNLPRGEGSRRLVLASEVKVVGRVGSSVTLGGHVSGGAGVEVILGDLNGLLQSKGILDKGGNETRDDVPLDVAMEEPDTC
jgi:hypothetical protein